MSAFDSTVCPLPASGRRPIHSFLPNHMDGTTSHALLLTYIKSHPFGNFEEVPKQDSVDGNGES